MGVNGPNVEVQLNSDVSDLLDISNSNLNYPNYYWDISFLEDLIYEENPIIYIPQPSNDTIITSRSLTILFMTTV